MRDQVLANTVGIDGAEIARLRELFRRELSVAKLLRHVLVTYPGVHSVDLHDIIEDVFCLKPSQSRPLAGWHWWEPVAPPPMTDARLDELLHKEIEAARARWDHPEGDPHAPTR